MQYGAAGMAREHDEMSVRLSEVAHMIAGDASAAEKVAYCESSLHMLWSHMQQEEAYMRSAAYPDDRLQAHAEHHRRIHEILSAEIWRMIEGGSDGRRSIAVAYELMHDHRDRFDHDLTRHAIISKYLNRPADG